MAKKCVILGVDGNLGSAVAEYVQRLLPADDLVFTAPTPEPLDRYSQRGIRTSVANFTAADDLVPVLENADKVLLISMPFVGEDRRKAHKAVIDACVAGNVRQIVYTSVLSASNPLNPSIESIDHGYTEASIQNTSLDYIILRNTLFAEAFITDYLRTVDNGDTQITKNMGKGKVAFVSRRDGALAAACAVANDLLHRAVLNINGIESVSYSEFLAIGNEVTGHHLTYREQSDEELYEYFDSIGVPRTTDGDFTRSPIQAASEGMVSFGTAIAEGFLDVPVNDFPKLTGRQPLSLTHMFERLDDFQLGDRHSTDK